MKRKPAPAYNGPTTLGLDISKWQSMIHKSMPVIAESNPDLKFCICRTGDGKTPDPDFDVNYKAVVDAGLIPGSYHYLRADRDGDTQAYSMIRMLEQVKYDPSAHLPPVVDLEDGAQTNLPEGVYTGSNSVLPRQQVHEETLEMLARLELELGVRPMLYTGQAFHWWYSQGNPQFAQEYAKYPLWLPSYGTRALMPVDKDGNFFPWQQWTIWQFTNKGTLNGTSYKLDLNYFRGSLEDLKNFIRASDRIGTLPDRIPEVTAPEDLARPPFITEDQWVSLYKLLATAYGTFVNAMQQPLQQTGSALSNVAVALDNVAVEADRIEAARRGDKNVK